MVKRLIRTLVRPDVLRDFHVYGGLALAAIGGWHLSPALTGIAVGITLMLLGLLPPRPQ